MSKVDPVEVTIADWGKDESVIVPVLPWNLNKKPLNIDKIAKNLRKIYYIFKMFAILRNYGTPHMTLYWAQVNPK